MNAFLLCAVVSFASANSYYERIYFPTIDTNRLNKATHDRAPLIDVRRCKENEYLFPGDNRYDWACDCKPGYIYYPNDGLCHEAYRRGPCKDGEILTIFYLGNFRVPKCTPNECGREGLVVFNSQCQHLDSFTPCRIYEYLIGRKTYLTVNPSTFGLTCSDDDHFFECNDLCCTDHNGRQECLRKYKK